jgi:beta-carotene 3-hydroxylase
MQILIPVAIVALTVAAMEVVANLSHKYIMHGWGWGWHRSHHVEHDDTFERNDLYALVFAIPSIVLIYLGSRFQNPIIWIGTGMAAYGFLYFVVHDGLVHQRWPFRIVPKNSYLKRLVQAHRLHHAVRTREGCVSFGFLYTRPVSELREALRNLHGDRLRDSRETGPTSP